MIECFYLWASQVSDIPRSMNDVANWISTTSPTSADRIHNWEDCHEDLAACTWYFPSGENEAKSSDDFPTDRLCVLSVAISTLHRWWSQSASCLHPVSKCWQNSRAIPKTSYYCRWTLNPTNTSVPVCLGWVADVADFPAFRVGKTPRTKHCEDDWRRNMSQDRAPSHCRWDS